MKRRAIYTCRIDDVGDDSLWCRMFGKDEEYDIEFGFDKIPAEYRKIGTVFTITGYHGGRPPLFTFGPRAAFPGWCYWKQETLNNPDLWCSQKIRVFLGGAGLMLDEQLEVSGTEEGAGDQESPHPGVDGETDPQALVEAP